VSKICDRWSIHFMNCFEAHPCIESNELNKESKVLNLLIKPPNTTNKMSAHCAETFSRTRRRVVHLYIKKKRMLPWDPALK
jgi:hypothetical protein